MESYPLHRDDGGGGHVGVRGRVYVRGSDPELKVHLPQPFADALLLDQRLRYLSVGKDVLVYLHEERIVDEQKRKRREEMPRRLDSTDELIASLAAGRNPDEDERQQELANEVEKEKALDRGWRLSRLSW